MGISYHKQLKMALFVVCLLFVIFSVAIYFYPRGKEQKKKNLVVNFKTSDVIMIESVLPTSDDLGKTFIGEGTAAGIQGYVEFFVQNQSDQEQEFVIFLNKQKLEKEEIKGEYVKLYLTDENDYPYEGFNVNPVPSYKDFPVLTNKPGKKLLYTSVLGAGEKKNFRLRLWLSDQYGLLNQNEGFAVDVEVQ